MPNPGGDRSGNVQRRFSTTPLDVTCGSIYRSRVSHRTVLHPTSSSIRQVGIKPRGYLIKISSAANQCSEVIQLRAEVDWLRAIPAVISAAGRNRQQHP